MKSYEIICIKGSLFWFELMLISIGWLLRKLRVIKEDSLLLNYNTDLGWLHRPSFEWEEPGFQPDESDLKAALSGTHLNMHGHTCTSMHSAHTHSA